MCNCFFVHLKEEGRVELAVNPNKLALGALGRVMLEKGVFCKEPMQIVGGS